MNKSYPALVLVFVLAAALSAADAPAAGPYAGEQKRDITTLTADDVAELMAGGGWGLARPAELNGYPGPRHVLDLASELGLDDKQRAVVAAVFASMNAEARRAGAAYVEAERALDRAFRSGRIDGDTLAERVAETGQLRDRLRRIHLAAHLETAPILTPEQRHLYRRLRGHHAGQDGGGDRHPHSGGRH
ncbi:MAG: periplasmic heavy metal sensor [Rhodospirillales bacterium]|nr:periplasmic heavy metal sensor [Rhodospirillales bacterium]